MSITCFDSDGNVLRELYQWDHNQTLEVRGIDMPPIPVFHFCNRFSNLALVVNPTVSGTSVTVSIPNILLQQAETIIAYVYQDTENNGCRTMHAIYIPVIPRPKPDDYEYEDNVDYVSVAILNSRLNDLHEEFDEYVSENDISYLGLLYNESDGILYITKNGEIISDGVRIATGVELDTTLSQSGKAADAKAVGDALDKLSESMSSAIDEKIGSAIGGSY